MPPLTTALEAPQTGHAATESETDFGRVPCEAENASGCSEGRGTAQAHARSGWCWQDHSGRARREREKASGSQGVFRAGSTGFQAQG